MVQIEEGARVRVRYLEGTDYSTKLHNRNAGRTGTVTKRYGCPASVMVVFDSTVMMQSGYPSSSCLYSLDGVELVKEGGTCSECFV